MSTVVCTYTLKLSTVLYFVVVYVLLAKGIAHNDHSLCFCMCVFEIICGAKRNNKESKLARLF